MYERVQFWSGGWWRFSRYEIRNGAIRPAENGSLEQYDPWDLYRISKRDSGTSPPYQSLLALLLSLGAFFDETKAQWKLDKRIEDGSLTPDNQDEILGWCSRFGLVGILPQTALTIETPLVRAARDEQWRRLGKGLKTLPLSHLRMNGEWISEFQPPIESELRDRVPMAFCRRFVFEDFLWDALPVTHFPDMTDWNKTHPSSSLPRQFENLPVASLLPVFFPDFTDEANDFRCPLPLSMSFWRIYSERVDDFLSFAMAFLAAVEPISAHRDTADLSKLQWFLEPTGIALSFDSEYHVVEQWVCPSLLSSYARMALQDISAGMRILRCDGCREPFVTSAYQSRYCSQRCAWKHRKRKARAPRNEQSTAGTSSIKKS